jgi:hypothetical protein
VLHYTTDMRQSAFDTMVRIASAPKPAPNGFDFWLL